jgi:hypothetical protein
VNAWADEWPSGTASAAPNKTNAFAIREIDHVNIHSNNVRAR